jgi:hypothetical protein
VRFLGIPCTGSDIGRALAELGLALGAAAVTRLRDLADTLTAFQADAGLATLELNPVRVHDDDVLVLDAVGLPTD